MFLHMYTFFVSMFQSLYYIYCTNLFTSQEQFWDFILFYRYFIAIFIVMDWDVLTEHMKITKITEKLIWNWDLDSKIEQIFR